MRVNYRYLSGAKVYELFVDDCNTQTMNHNNKFLTDKAKLSEDVDTRGT